MHQAVDSLPTNYEQRGSLDLSKNRLATLGLTVAAAGLLFPVGWLLLRFISATRSDESSFDLRLDLSGTILLLAAFVALSFSIALVHELVHGLSFWLVTHRRPVFGFRGLYAFAAAPGWYIPSGQYLVIGLAPLVSITLAGLAILPVIPVAAVPPLFLFVLFNAAGSTGDILAVFWILTRAPATLVHDAGDAITIFQPTHSACPVIGRSE
ncbi:MAG: DUF3267 domain-containing protein [Chloroflexota bacterium]|jgi:hypothetical protein